MNSRVAILVIDMQKAYFHNDALEARRAELVAKANELIGWGRDHGVPVFNVTTEHKWDRSTWTLNMLEDEDGYLLGGDMDTEVVDGLVVEGSIAITKTRDSAFFGTDLAVQLRSRDVDTIILLGVSTHSCILHTAADAYARDFKVVIAKEAVASHDPRFHEPILKMLAQEYRQPHLTNGAIRELLQS